VIIDSNLSMTTQPSVPRIPHASGIPFVKATACGNDFLIIDSAQAPNNIAAFTRRICDRHHGVGADGVEWLLPGDADSDLGIRLLNADGSEAEISGNGTRCVAAWYCARQQRESVVIRTGAGLKICELRSRNGNTFEFRSSMGVPVVGAEFALHVPDGESRGLVVSTGNPHYVVFVSEFQHGWQSLGEQISVHPHFPQGTNVEFVKVRNRSEIEVRFLERGVGETMSSGTGSSAAAVASMHAGKTQSPLRVHASGGSQTVEWDGEIFLTGPATLLCSGEFWV
jgi:diaminopimelate epimerase